MGVCIEERPVMHWQQSARFLGPGAKEKSLSPQIEHHRTNFCGTDEGVISNRIPYTSSCPEICNHNSKPFGIVYKEKYKSYDTTECSIFDESSNKCPIGKNQMDCPEVSDETNSGISFKTEPFGPPSSPESTTDTNIRRNQEDCAGCGRFIQDRFYLSAVEKRWHVTCLQCHACQLPLDRESSCYSRDGNIYCKSDYYSFYGARRCSRCLASISSSELVMRARNLVFHVNCFCCAACQTPLTKGDQFGIIDGVVYCRSHYIIAREGDPISSKLGGAFTYTDQYGSPQGEASTPQQDTHRIIPSTIFMPTAHVITGISQAPRQKGRPRKRKPKDIEALTANMDLNTEYLDFNRGSHMSGSSRTKRMRTSFKHHQLRTMKSYFAINHNPDAKDLKQLSQKTGLPKRVLQVWFQNARAKWRRMMMKQDGSTALDKSEGNLDLDSISTHSPSSFLMANNNSSPHSLD